MTRIPFALFPFPDPAISAPGIERRLRSHLTRLIAAKIGMELPLNANGTIDEDQHRAMLDGVDLPYAQTRDATPCARLPSFPSNQLSGGA